MNSRHKFTDPWQQGYYDEMLNQTGKYSGTPPKPPHPAEISDVDAYYYQAGRERAKLDILKKLSGINDN